MRKLVLLLTAALALTACTAVVGGPGAPDIAAGLGRLGEGTHDADILILQYLLVLGRVVRGVQNLRRIVDELIIQRQRIGTMGFIVEPVWCGEVARLKPRSYFFSPIPPPMPGCCRCSPRLP